MSEETVPIETVHKLEKTINELQNELAIAHSNELVSMRMLLQYVMQEKEIYKQALNEQQ